MKSTFLLTVLVLTAIHLHGQQRIVFLQINKSDSLARALEGKKFISNEQKYHQMIWRIKDVRKQAQDLTKKGKITFTMTDDWPCPESQYFIISFYEMIMDNQRMDRYTRLQTYRIDKRMKLERYNTEEDSWNPVAQ